MSGSNAGDLYDKHRKTVIDLLNKAANTAFTPTLDKIDAVMASLKVK